MFSCSSDSTDRRSLLKAGVFGVALGAGQAIAAPSSAYAVGLFTELKGTPIPPEIQVIQTRGYQVPGVGAAVYQRTANVGEARFRSRSADGAWWELSQGPVTLAMLGAEGQEGAVQVPQPVTFTAPAAASGKRIIVGKRQIFRGGCLAATGASSPPLIIAGGDVQVEDLRIAGDTPGPQLIGAAANAGGLSNVRLRSLVLGDASGRIQHGVNLAVGGLRNWSFRDLTIDSAGYGFLTNVRAGESGASNMRLMDFSISGGADAIELNAPYATQTNTVIWGGHLEAGLAGRANRKTSGFSLGLAHCSAFVAGGFVSIGSSNEGVHVEDGSSLGVLSAFVLNDTGAEGIRHYRSGRNWSEGTPIVFSGFAATRADRTAFAGSSGFYNAYDAQGTQGRSPIVAAYFKGYETGLYLNGPELFSVGYVSVDGAANVLRLSSMGKAISSVAYSEGAKVFLQERGGRGGGAEAGAFHQLDSAPLAIIEPSAQPGRTVACVAEFSCPALGVLPSDVGAATGVWVDLFAAPALMNARIKVRALSQESLYWSANVFYDGGTIIVERVLSKKGGQLEVLEPNLKIEDGKVKILMRGRGGGILKSVWIHLVGEYCL